MCKVVVEEGRVSWSDKVVVGDLTFKADLSLRRPFSSKHLGRTKN